MPGAEQGMNMLNRMMTYLARTWPTPIYVMCSLQQATCRRWPERMFELGEREFPRVDVEVLRRPEVRKAFLEDFRRAPPSAARAAAREFALFGRDWGFRLEDITVPVHLWHGDLDR